MKSSIMRKSRREVEELMQIGSTKNTSLKHMPKLQQIQNLEYIFEMLSELRIIAKKTGEESLVYYLEMAALETGEICDTFKLDYDAGFEKPGSD